MKRFAFLIALLFLTGTTSAASEIASRSPIVGRWQFYKILFRGEEHPPFTSNLILTFEFNPGGSDRLHWTRDGQHGFCERTGRYQWSPQQSLLMDEITWVNPENAPGCARDPDMTLGRRTETKVEIADGELNLWLSVGDEPLIYVWKRMH